jgi:TonB family protein
MNRKYNVSSKSIAGIPRLCWAMLFLLACRVMVAKAQPNCISLAQILKMQEVSIGEIQPFLHQSSWAFDDAKSKINANGFRITEPMDYVRWKRTGFGAEEILEVYSCTGKRNIVKLVTTQDCYHLLTESLFNSNTGETQVVDGALLTLFSIGNSRIETHIQKLEYSSITHTVVVYDFMHKDPAKAGLSFTDLGVPMVEDTPVPIASEVESVPVLEVGEPEVGKVFTYVEEQPTFPGGEEGMYEYLQKNIKYPALAKKNGIAGRVFLTFIVGSDGYLHDIKVLRGIGHGCDEEAVRVLENMPPWKPGKQNGKHVNVQFNMPINFSKL